MSIVVPMEGFGGGGTSLNFNVVGNPQPENPKVNTIWVNTDVPITSWIFNVTQPETAENGMVWIFNGASSPVEFDALKKNSIQVYPISVKQYVDGAWVSKTAKSYQGGEWVDWIVYLYNKGDKCVVLTGGWTETKGISDESYSRGTHADNGTSLSLTVSGNKNSASWRTTDMIDITDVSTIYANITQNTSGHTDVYIAKDSNYNTNAALVAANSVGVVALDVSSFSGSYYISVHRHTNSSGGNAGTGAFDQMWMI